MNCNALPTFYLHKENDVSEIIEKTHQVFNSKFWNARCIVKKHLNELNRQSN